MGNTALSRFAYTEPTSFVYEDLVSHVKSIQHQIIEITKFLDDQWKNKNTAQNQFKSRSLIFIDPYGNPIVDRYMDHKSISSVLRKYKKDYVPKYLQEWIKIGTMNSNNISPLNENQLESTVSEYADGHQFFAYVEVIVLMGNCESQFQNIRLRVLPTDTLAKIKTQIQNYQKWNDIELRLFTISQNSRAYQTLWNEGLPLRLEDTIMSCKLSTKGCFMILAKLVNMHVSYAICFFFSFHIIQFFLISGYSHNSRS
jgi:hypothetical protein